MDQEIEKISKKLMKELDEDRYRHTQGVMYTSAALAMRYGADLKKALLAGLLHDCAKCIPNNEKIDICRKHDILVSQVELDNPGLLHAKAGMVLAEEEYQITDPDILHSIKVHTTGEPGMNMLDKIIFVADYIEPGRNEAPRLEYLRKIAFHDIDMTVAEILHDTIHYLNSKSGAIDPATQITYNYYERYRKETH